MRLPHILSTLASITLACSISSMASAETGLYLGASLGNAKVGFKDPDSTLHLDDSDAGYKIFAGFQFTIAAVEAGFVDFGLIEDNENSIEVSGFNAFGKVSFGLGPVEVFGKAGGFVWDSDFESAQESYSENGFDPVIGIGGAINLGNVGVRAEYEYYDISEFEDVSMISIGATWWLL